MNHALLKQTFQDCVQAGSQVLMQHFGRLREYRIKENQSSIVTIADVESERRIVEIIRGRFPTHSIIAEETGYVRQSSHFTWVIDPLDGTSNFAAGLPWFGIMLALLEDGEPIMAAAFIPCANQLYFSAKGTGAQRNDEPVRVSRETELPNILCAFGLDAAAGEAEVQRQAQLLCRIASRVRNVRATNSLVDLGLTVDGRLGACLNLNMKIWDIAPWSLLLPEAGGLITDLEGNVVRYDLAREPFDRTYTVLAANPPLHAQLVQLTRQAI